MQHYTKPVFLFAFANDTQKSLQLSDEERALRNILAPAHDQGRLEVIQLGHAELDEVYQSFNRFHNRVALFHFGGHSSHEFLHLADANARSAALATLIGQQRNLRLVFLNGCANREQVAALFDQGIKAVIATSVPVNDQNALHFAEHFYHALANGKTLRESFDTARSRTHNDTEHPPVEHYWDIPPEDLAAAAFPWGLYTQDDKDLDWVIPAARSVPANLDYFQEVPLHWPEVNKELVTLAFAGMAQLPEHPSFGPLYQLHLNDTSGAFFNTLQNALLDAFPTMLSVQIRDLFTPEGKTKGRVRLREFDEAYDTLARLLCAIALANLWEAAAERIRNEADPISIAEPCRQAIRKYLAQTPATGTPADQLWLVNEIGIAFAQNGIEPYVSELAALAEQLRNAAEFHTSYHFFEHQLRRRLLANDIPSGDVEPLCREAERHFGILLQHCAFLCNYQLVTVKVISVDMPRHESDPGFIYQKAVLKGRDYATIDMEPLQMDQPCSNNSVFISALGDLQEHGLQLNLSPFLIDQNAYRSNENCLPKIYFFDGLADQELHFLHADTTESDFTVAAQGNDPDYRNVTSLFKILDHFQQDIGLSTN